MGSMFFRARDISEAVKELNLRYSEEIYLINKIWLCENIRLEPEYRKDLKKFMLDVRFSLHSVFNCHDLVKEYNEIMQKRNLTCGIYNSHELDDSIRDEYYIFKRMRIRYLNDSRKSCIRIKKKNLVSIFDKNRIKDELYSALKRVLEFYDIYISVSGDEICDIRNVSSESILVLRIKKW